MPIAGSHIYAIRARDGRLYIGAGRARARIGRHLNGKGNTGVLQVIESDGKSSLHVHSWDTGSAIRAALTEQWLINFYGGPDSRKLLNNIAGGGKWGRVSEEIKRKLRRPKSSQARKNMSASRKELWKDETYRANAIASITGRKKPGLAERNGTPKMRAAVAAKNRVRAAKIRAWKSACGVPWRMKWKAA